MAIKEIKYSDVEQRAQTIKTYVDEAAEAAKTQANAYTDEQIKNIPAPPAPDIPTALPQKYEAFKVQLVQGNISEGENPIWSEYHEILWNGNITLTAGARENFFITDTVIDYPEPRKYSLLLTVGGVEKELKHVGYSGSFETYTCTENGVVVLNADVQGMNTYSSYYNNTTKIYVYCPTGSALIGQSLTAARYGKKQYLYSLMNPAAILQYPSETENARFLTMCQSIATKNAKLKLTLTDNVIEANYANISNELVTTDYVNEDVRARWIGVVADRVPNKAYGTYIYDDMPTCIKGVLEVEYTDEEATKECVYDKIQGESYTFKIGDFNHEESSAFDYYFNGSALIPFDNAQIQASFAYRPVSGEEKAIQVKSMYGAMDGGQAQYLPFFDISELFGQAANTVMAAITSNTAVENVDMGGRPVTTISLTSNIQNFTDANDEIRVGQILTIMPSSLPQTYKKKAVTLATSGWTSKSIELVPTGKEIYFASSPRIGETITPPSDINPADIQQFVCVLGSEKQTASFVFSSSTDDERRWTATIVRSGTTYNLIIRYRKSVNYFDFFYAEWHDTATQLWSMKPVGADKYTQSYTDADVKVNSEVRFTLDEANGKIAGQFGLKKTIDKEAGKLTFTADTLPTSAISGTLEIGETSTEGAAFVDGIATSVNGGEASSGGTVTSVAVKMNGSVKGTVTTSGTIDLGTVVTDVSGKQDKITADNKLDASLVSGLATVATSGSYNDLSNKPTIPSPVTETTVSDWGFTKNTGTVTSVAVKMNGANKGTVTGSGTIDLGTVLTSWDDVGSEAVISIIGKALYPVGAIYMSTTNVNPSTFITGTTWVAWGSGKVPVGVDTSDTSFNAVEKTGGEKTHTLTESEMPKHAHTGTNVALSKYNASGLGGITLVEKLTLTADYTSVDGGEVDNYATAAKQEPLVTLTDRYGIPKGGDEAHNNLQPYITCYMFKRTV